MSIWEELNGIDIRLVSSEGLDSLASANIPQLCKCVTGTGNECVLVGWVDADAHDISEMIGELGDLLSGLDIPLHTSHISRGSKNAAIVDEATAGKVAGVAGKFSRDTGWSFPVGVEVVNRANVVESSAGDIVSAGCVCAGHDP